jgi:hypothetical protein
MSSRYRKPLKIVFAVVVVGVVLVAVAPVAASDDAVGGDG